LGAQCWIIGSKLGFENGIRHSVRCRRQSNCRSYDRPPPTSKRSRAVCRRLLTIPGVGPITATAVVAAIGNGAAFKKGRSFAAWLGLVPRQYSTGSKTKLLGIGKRGNPYLRRVFILGAQSLMMHMGKSQRPSTQWLKQHAARAHRNVVVVALANKIARIAWAVLYKEEVYPIQGLSSEASPKKWGCTTKSKTLGQPEMIPVPEGLCCADFLASHRSWIVSV